MYIKIIIIIIKNNNYKNIFFLKWGEEGGRKRKIKINERHK